MQNKNHMQAVFVILVAAALMVTAVAIPPSIANGNQPPIANFYWEPEENITSGETVHFYDNSTDPDGTIIAWQWDFDDGTYSIEKNPTHVFGDSGNYDVNLTIIDNNGSTDSVVKRITVQNQPPVADAGPDQLVNTTEVHFDGTGSEDPDGTIESYTWQFGDGQTGSGATVTHDYEEDGQYTVTLNVTDDAGAYDTDTCQVIVDTVSPHTNVSLNGTEGNNGWYVSNVTVTLDADDNLSGVEDTYYSLDDGNWTEYTAPFVISEEGEHIVAFFSRDAAGNKEEERNISVDIDKSPPVVTITSPAEGYIHFFGRELLPSIRSKTILIGRITVEAEAADQASWINKVQFSVDGEVRYNDMQEPYTWTWGLAFGRHTLGVTAIDAAGHEATEEIDVTIFSLIPGRSGDVTQDQTSTPPAS